MKTFLYGIGIMAEAGIATTFGFLLWVFTGWDALEIIAVDMVVTFFASLMMLLKIEEIAKGEKQNGENY